MMDEAPQPYVLLVGVDELVHDGVPTHGLTFKSPHADPLLLRGEDGVLREVSGVKFEWLSTLFRNQEQHSDGIRVTFTPKP